MIPGKHSLQTPAAPPVSYDPRCTVFNAGKQLTMENAHEIMWLIRAMPSGENPAVIVNMSQTIAIDSTGVGALVSTMRHVRQHRGSFCVTNLVPEIERVFQMMNLNNVIDVFETVELAIQHLNAKTEPISGIQ